MAKFNSKAFVADRVHFSDGFFHIESGTFKFSLKKENLSGMKVRKGDTVTLYLTEKNVIVGVDINGVRCYLDD